MTDLVVVGLEVEGAERHWWQNTVTFRKFKEWVREKTLVMVVVIPEVSDKPQRIRIADKRDQASWVAHRWQPWWLMRESVISESKVN